MNIKIFKLKTVSDYQEAEEYQTEMLNRYDSVKVETVDNLNYEVIKIISKNENTI